MQAFLDGRTGFAGIPRVIAAVMDRLPAVRLDSLGDVLAADAEARKVAESVIVGTSME